MTPGGGDAVDSVSSAPTFTWKDDSSEDRDAVELLDSRGLVVWRNGSNRQGDRRRRDGALHRPGLDRGQPYQFRVTSFRRRDVPISQTENVRGVFLAR